MRRRGSGMAVLSERCTQGPLIKFADSTGRAVPFYFMKTAVLGRKAFAEMACEPLGARFGDPAFLCGWSLGLPW
jgi:hypothetical protein